MSWCKCPGVPPGQPPGMAADKCINLLKQTHLAYFLIDSGRLHAQACMSTGPSKRWPFHHGMDNSHHLAQDSVQIFVRKTSVLRLTSCFLRAIMFIILQTVFATRAVLKTGEYLSYTVM